MKNAYGPGKKFRKGLTQKEPVEEVECSFIRLPAVQLILQHQSFLLPLQGIHQT